MSGTHMSRRQCQQGWAVAPPASDERPRRAPCADEADAGAHPSVSGVGRSAPTPIRRRSDRLVEIRGLGGADFERALEQFRAGRPVRYRDLELVLRGAALDCRVRAADTPDALTSRRALEALTRARFRLGALLA